MQCYSHRIVITRLLQDHPLHLQKHLVEDIEHLDIGFDALPHYRVLEKLGESLTIGS